MPLLQFKAGRATRQGDTNTVVCEPDRGLITIEEQDGLLHFLYTSLSSPARPVLDDLIIFPGDASFLSVPSSSPAYGRAHCLKFNSSSARHFYWSQDAELSAEEYEARGRTVNELIGGSVEEESGAMEVEADPSSAPAPAAAPFETPAPNRTADSAPGAPKKGFGSEAQMAQLQNILASLGGGAGAGGSGGGFGGMGQAPSFTLPDVLPPSAALSLLHSLPPSSLAHLSSFLPPPPNLPTSTPAEQLASLARAVSSPEFRRALASLDRALRTGATGPLVQGLGMGQRAAEGTEEFLEEVERQGEEARMREEGPGGSGGSA
ncbi:hypothetical protein JCM6882_004396 [Rhodosporidiobolus microsporus]